MPDPSPGFPFHLSERYEVVAEIGRGAFATVYRAKDSVFGRDVAVKMLREESLPRVAVERFSREMQVTAGLEHPNILHVYDTGTFEGALFYVMELVRGRTLEQRLETEGPLPVSDALAIGREIGQALAFAHSRGVVHRDVKPANILLGASGALLGDFGIAHVFDEDEIARLTSTGYAVGTMLYMSPEQLCADPMVDARCDQYALALVYYEMLTGVRPHIASTIEGLRALRCSGTSASVFLHRAAVPRHVDDAIARALSVTPADRFRDVTEFLLAIDGANTAERNALGTGGSSVREGSVSGSRLSPVGLSKEATLGSRRRTIPRSATLVGAVALLLGAIGAVYVVRRPVAGGVAPVASQELSVAVMRAPTGGDSIFASRLQAELQEWDDVVLNQASPTPAAAKSVAAFRSMAGELKATLVMDGTRTVVGDSLRYVLDVYDSRIGRMRHLTRSAPASGDRTDAGLRGLVARALTGIVGDSALGIEGLASPSLFTAREYAVGWRYLRAGSFDSAGTTFREVARASPAFAPAHLWAAQVGAWSEPREPASWRDEAARALELRGSLTGVDSLVAAGLVAMSTGSPLFACGRYRAALERDRDSFSAWFGLGECQRLDSMIIADPHVPGGKRFRSSSWSAVTAYRQALDHLPDPRMSWLFSVATPITYASGNKARTGIALPPDTARYVAFPSLAGDTIQTIPVPRAAFIRSAPGSIPESFSRAIKAGRESLLQFTAVWVARAPSLAEAWAERAYALELSGLLDAPELVNSASRALAHADSLGGSDMLKARVDVARTRVAVRRGHFDEAARIASDALARKGALTATVARMRAPLAAFVGDADATSALLRTAATSSTERARLPEWAAAMVTPWLDDSLRSFGVRALLGKCEGLAARREAIENGLSQQVAVADLAERRERLLHEVYRAATACLGPSVVRGFRVAIPLDEAFVALDARDREKARAILSKQSAVRRGMDASTLTQDALLAETLASIHVGDTIAARVRLRANIADIASVNPYTFDEVAQAAAVHRLRALAGAP